MKKPPAIKQTKPKKQQSPFFLTKPGKLILWTGLLLAISFIVYSPALKNELVNWDDYNYIRDNPAIQSLSMSNILNIFNFRTFIMGNYHPFTILSYAIEYKFAKADPFLYHLDNILLHLINISLFCWLMWCLTRKYYAALIAAALFAVHPMRVESVVWAAERKDVLYTCFYLLALISYLFFLTRQKNNRKFYFLSLFLFLFSVLSKGQAVVLPLTFLLIDYWFSRKITLANVLNKIPFFALSILFGILAIQAQSSSLTTERLASHTFFERLVFASFNIIAYLYKLVFPYKLSCFYGYPKSDEMGFVYAGGLMAILIVTLVLVFLRKNRIILFGTLFFLFTVFIVIQLMPIGNAIIADRYTYIPYIGLFFIIAMLLDPLIQDKMKKWSWIRYPLIIQFCVFCIFSFIQSGIWRNNATLWENVIKNNPREGMAYNNVATEYMERKEYDKAKEALYKSIHNSENYPEVYRSYHNLGKAYSESGDPQKGISFYTTALTISPTFQDAYFGRGLTYTDMGKYDSAVADFTYILNNLQPNHAMSFYSRAMAYKKSNRLDSAIIDYGRAIKVKPDYSDAYTNRGNIYFNREELDKALTDYNEALKYVPDDGKTYLNRSFTYFKKGDFEHALLDADSALKYKGAVSPDYIKDLKNIISRKK
jgi:tetratricopeptide (TPR) repeat protein